MDMNSESNLGEAFRFSTLGDGYDSMDATNSPLHVLAATCSVCQRNLSPDDDDVGDLEGIRLCGDCRFLLLEDLGNTSPDVYSRRAPTSRRTRHGSSESMESMFSEQFSQMINGSARLARRSTRTTPSGSRRWRRVLSDTESDGFDSLYGDAESNVSIRRYRLFNGDADTMSYGAYGGDSDASVDGQSFFENENIDHPDRGSDLESDTDIDPMNAGLYQWNSEEDGDEAEDDSEWEESDTEGNTIESSGPGGQLHGPLRSNRSNFQINWRRQFLYPEVEGTFLFRTGERILAHAADMITNFQESEAQNFVAGSGDYLDARGIEILVGNLAETENSRIGAPPTSASFVKNLPRMTIKEDTDKRDSLACAVCRDSLTIGTVVNQLPCFHLYHPTCILPWLNARSTCPLCRYELPTDDKEYEERKRSRAREYASLHVQQPNVSGDSSLNASYVAVADEPSPLHLDREGGELVDANSNTESGAGENPRNGWFFLAAAAAPIVSMVGISLMLWLGKTSADRRWPSGRICYRRENGQRRWWSLF